MIDFENNKKSDLEVWSKLKKPHGDFNTYFRTFLNVSIHSMTNIKTPPLTPLHNNHKLAFPSSNDAAPKLGIVMFSPPLSHEILHLSPITSPP